MDMMIDILPTETPVLAMPEPPQYKAFASLDFLPSGQYLFTQYAVEGKHKLSKFVTPADVAAAFTGLDQDTGWIPPGVVRVGGCSRGSFFVYSAPAQKVQIYLTGTGEPHAKEDKQYTLPIPRTVLLGVGRSYYIWCLKSSSFDPNASAYKAPFPNTAGDGSICWGGNTPPEAKPENARKAWELFFASPFNNHQDDGKSLKYQKDVRHMLIAASRGHKYPADDLVAIDQKISVLIERIIH